MSKNEIHHSAGLFQFVICDGSRFGKPIRNVKEKWRVPRTGNAKPSKKIPQTDFRRS
jgi:hypothetical protein